MAKVLNKKDNKEAKEEVIDMEEITMEMPEETIVVVDEIVVEPEVQEVTIDTTTIDRPEKMVRIKVKEKFKCFIGEWYYFEKNHVYSVPEHVKSTLMERDKLLPM